MKRKLGFVGIIQLVCVVLSLIISVAILISQNAFSFIALVRWSIFLYVILMLLSNVVLSHKFAQGRLQEILFLASTSLLVSNLLGFVLYALIRCNFKFKTLDWFGFLERIVRFDIMYYGIVLIMFIAFVAIYCYFIDRRMLLMLRSGIRGKGKLKQVETNLENSRWMNDEERDKIFNSHKYSKLGEVKKDGIPVMAKLTDKGRDMKVVFNSPCHSLIIGSTGSGKTTTFVSPMIQLLAASAAGSSMIHSFGLSGSFI
jgi:type IV secretory pathway TraG/TraD family ATPase VirD4